MDSPLKLPLRKKPPHPYLSGNFAPVATELPLTPCSYSGTIPKELAGGQYIRNGGNPVVNQDLGRAAHWFDGDGMLTGVLFRRTESGTIQPEFVNAFVLTDIYLSAITSRHLKTPLIPSVTSLINPLSTLLCITLHILRTVVLIFLSHLPGSTQVIKKISVVNTGILFHDGRALATCESGPPMRITLPELETVGWYDGRNIEGEPPAASVEIKGFGGDELLGDWTTGHPRVDPITGEFIAFHNGFFAPYVHYSVIPLEKAGPPPLLSAPVPGITSGKLMHDFGVSLQHTVILDLPVSLDPINLVKNQPIIKFNPNGKSRFGIFPRWEPHQVRWFESDEACCIFHTANSWDDFGDDIGQDDNEKKANGDLDAVAVNLLACQLNSAGIIFNTGNIPAPPIPGQMKENLCQLTYYRFSLNSGPEHESKPNIITHNWALTAISFEFPTVSPKVSMRPAKYIYGCSMLEGSFNSMLGKSAKIDCLVKIDVETLIAKGKESGGLTVHSGGPVVDNRSIKKILEENKEHDIIKIFQSPPGWFAQEMSFIPAAEGGREDDGWLVMYMFNEGRYLDPQTDEVIPDAKSELWVLDARNMENVVCKVELPERVPYGLHGEWFSESQVHSQRPVECVREVLSEKSCPLPSPADDSVFVAAVGLVRNCIEMLLG